MDWNDEHENIQEMRRQKRVAEIHKEVNISGYHQQRWWRHVMGDKRIDEIQTRATIFNFKPIFLFFKLGKYKLQFWQM